MKWRVCCVRNHECLLPGSEANENPRLVDGHWQKTGRHVAHKVSRSPAFRNPIRRIRSKFFSFSTVLPTNATASHPKNYLWFQISTCGILTSTLGFQLGSSLTVDCERTQIVFEVLRDKIANVLSIKRERCFFLRNDAWVCWLLHSSWYFSPFSKNE